MEFSRVSAFKTSLCTALVLLFASFALSSGQAPTLEGLVQTGDLPPLEERIPLQPLVVEPYEAIGEYGGTWRMAATSIADVWMLRRHLGYEYMMRWNPEFTESIPNLVESVEASDDAREYTFKLREGMRWSDGHPHTTADYMFWYESVLQNESLTPSYPDWVSAGGELGVFEAIDDYTLKITFSQPDALFLYEAASAPEPEFKPLPKHYMEQFHADFADESELNELMAEAGVDTWQSLFIEMDNPWENPERPVFHPWIALPLEPPFDQRQFVRNPYYWKVDPEGNQLPYIDNVQIDIVTDVEVLELMAMNGEIDRQDRNILYSLDRLPLFTANQERGDYRITRKTGAFASWGALFPNLNHQDPVMREIIQDRRFRIALSVAMDRERIAELIHLGFVEPRQPAPADDSPLAYPDLAYAYVEHDPQMANDLLDEMGLTERNAAGYRLRPDGEVLRLAIDVRADRQDYIDGLELVKEDWEAVGVQTRVNAIDRTLFHERASALQHDVNIWSVAGGALDIFLDPAAFLPYGENSFHALEYVEWRLSNGERGVEPPADIVQTMEIWDEITQTASFDAQVELFHEIFELNRQNLWVIGLTSYEPRFGIVKNNFRNSPTEILFSTTYPSPSPYNPETFFFAD